MTFRTTLVLLAAALGLFVFIYFFESRLPGDSGKAPVARIISDLDPGSISAIEITRSNLVVRVQRTNENWQITNPVYPAQSTGIESLVTAVANAPRLSRVGGHDVQNEPGGLRAFGLEPPRATIMFQSSTGRFQLSIGGKAPVAGRIYVQLVGSSDVLVTDSGLLKHLPETINQWRDTRLLDSTSTRFDRVQVASGPRIFEIQRNSTNQQWQITRPLPGRADSNRVEELMVRLQNTPVIKFVQDTPALDLEPFGLQTPAATLSLGVDTNVLGMIEFGGSPTNDASQVYARNLARSNIVLISRELLDFLQQPYKNFHDPHLLEVPFKSITSIQVRAGESFEIEKREGKWMVSAGNFAVDSLLVGEMLTNIANLEIVDFAKDVPTEADLAQFGLLPPKREYTFLTVGTNLAGAATNTPLVRVDFGTNQIDTIYAKRSDETPVYKTITAAVDSLPTHAFQIRDRRLWNVPVGAITNVSFVFNDATTSLSRDGTGHWSSDDVFNAAVEEIFFRVSQARTARWVARGDQKAAILGLTSSRSRMTIGILEGGHSRQIALTFGGRTAARPANIYASYLPDDESERLIFEFPGALYQDLLRLMTPNSK